MGEVGQEAEDDAQVRPDEDALPRTAGGERVREGAREEAGVMVEPRGRRRRVPAQEREDDAGDECEDEVGLAEVRAGEPPRPHHLADHDGGDDTREDEQDEHVDELAEPRERDLGVTVDGSDERRDDGREEDDEAPEDEGVRQARDEALEQLALTEDELDLVARAPRRLRGPVVRRRAHHLPREEQGSPREDPATGEDEDGEGNRARQARTFFSSALIAGTISCRSPITA